MPASKHTDVPRKAPAKKTTAARKTTVKPAPQPTIVEVIQDYAEKAVVIPVGAALISRDRVAALVEELQARYGTRAAAEKELTKLQEDIEAELKKAERRGQAARKNTQRDLRQARTQVERALSRREPPVELDSEVVAARWLTRHLGEDFTAYVSAAAAEDVGRWCGGESPRNEQGPRLLRAYEAGRILVSAYDGDTTLAWFFGCNRALNDEAPAWLLRHTADDATLELLVVTAREFAQGSG